MVYLNLKVKLGKLVVEELKFTNNYITDALITEENLFNFWISFEEFDKYSSKYVCKCKACKRVCLVRHAQ